MSDLAHVEAEVDGPVCVVRIRGEVDISNVREVQEAIDRAVPNTARVVVLDLSEMAYLDSSGVSLLLRLGSRLSVRRQELRLVVPRTAPIRAVLELTGLPRVMTVTEERDPRLE